METKDEFPDIWSLERRQELELLRNLLYQLKSLDRGSNFIEKLQGCIKDAGTLIDVDLGGGKDNFFYFLQKLCFNDDTAK